MSTLTTAPAPSAWNARLRSDTNVRLGLPKGRMEAGVVQLLADAGIAVTRTARDYRPVLSAAGWSAKTLKPQSIVEMLRAGARDIGFTGADWVAELGADELVPLLDTGLNPVRLILAAPSGTDPLARTDAVVATEYVNLTTRWLAERSASARVLRSFGATEVLPPEDADAIVDTTATGATLTANGLDIIDDVMTSSTRLYANPQALDDPARRERIDALVLLLSAVLEARRRVMIEVNVRPERLDAIVDALPCLRRPTVAPLFGDEGFAVKAAIPREDLARLVPELRARGGTDIVVTTPEQIVR